MTKADLTEALSALGIDHDPRAKKSVLEQQLAAAQPAKAAPPPDLPDESIVPARYVVRYASPAPFSTVGLTPAHRLRPGETCEMDASEVRTVERAFEKGALPPELRAFITIESESGSPEV